MGRYLPFTVAIPTLANRRQLNKVVTTLINCEPGPSEILVHVDEPGDISTIQLPVDSRVRIISSSARVGPGGGRQLMIEIANYPWVASFDDDSWPESAKFFEQAAEILQNYPEIAVLSAASNAEDANESYIKQTSTYAGCGCIFVKAWFEKINGFLPLHYGYGFEEVDVSLQLHEIGGLLVTDSRLRVIHQREPSPHIDVHIGKQALSNAILFTAIRIPFSCLLVGVYKTAAYALKLWRNEGVNSVRQGLLIGISKIRQFSHKRKPVNTHAFLSWILLSQNSRRLLLRSINKRYIT